jgi:hypothetical protein
MKVLSGIAAFALLGMSTGARAEEPVTLFRDLQAGMSEAEVAAMYAIRKPKLGEEGIGTIGEGRHRYLPEKVVISASCEGRAKLTFYKEDKVQRLNHVTIHNNCETQELIDLLTMKYGTPRVVEDSFVPACFGSRIECGINEAVAPKWFLYRWNVNGLLIVLSTKDDTITYSAGVSADFESEL